MAPEVLKEKPYDERCDLWSFGITIYEIYNGYTPYGNKEDDTIIKTIFFNNKEYFFYYVEIKIWIF